MKSFLLMCIGATMFMACSTNQFIGSVYNDVRFKPLKKNVRVNLVYSPETILDIDRNAEYFDNLSSNQALQYEDKLKFQGQEINLSFTPDEAEYLFQVTYIRFSERTDRKCFRKDDDGNVQQDDFGNSCLMLNDINIELEGVLTDPKTKKTIPIKVDVDDKTRGGKSLIGGVITEKNGHFINILEFSVDRLMQKAAGKCARHIRKLEA